MKTVTFTLKHDHLNSVWYNKRTRRAVICPIGAKRILGLDRKWAQAEVTVSTEKHKGAKFIRVMLHNVTFKVPSYRYSADPTTKRLRGDLYPTAGRTLARIDPRLGEQGKVVGFYVLAEPDVQAGKITRPS